MARVGADLVCHIASGGDAVGSHDHAVDHARGDGSRAGRVHAQAVRNTLFREFPRGQARALEQRAGLAGDDLLHLAGRRQFADRAQRRTPGDGGQPPGVAVGQDPQRPRSALLAQESRGPGGRIAVRLFVLVQHGERLVEHGVGTFWEPGQCPSYAPGEVDRRGARGGDALGLYLDGGPVEQAVHGVVAGGQRDAERAGHSDGRCAAYRQSLYGIDELIDGGQPHDASFMGESSLVEGANGAAVPGDGAFHQGGPFRSVSGAEQVQ